MAQATRHFPGRFAPSALLSAALLFSACGPDLAKSNYELRHQVADQDAQLAADKQKIANRDAQIADLQNQLASKNPPLPTLPPDRLAQLFTAASIQIRNQTDVWDFGPQNGGRSGFRIFLRTLTDDGQIIPATGTLTLEAFELPAAPAQPQRIGSWTFTPEQMKQNWYTTFGSNYFAFNCPWATAPTHDHITITAHFTDALTGRHLDATVTKTVTLPATIGQAAAN